VTVFNRLIVKPPSFQDNWSITEQLHRGLKRGVGSIHYRKWLASRSYLEEATNTRYTARSFIHYNAVNTLKKFARCRNRDEISRLRLLDAVASLPPRVHHVNWSGKNYRRHRHSWRAAPRRHFGCIRSKSSDAIVHLSTDLIMQRIQCWKLSAIHLQSVAKRGKRKNNMKLLMRIYIYITDILYWYL